MIHKEQHGLGGTKDPIKQSGPDRRAELFKAVSKVCDGFSTEDVLSVAMNLLINSFRQAHTTWSGAETSFNEHFGKSKQILHECYDPNGKRRSVYPFHQVIEVPLIKFTNQFHQR